jgi:uncharacterized damage-inducible protein DinB
MSVFSNPASGAKEDADAYIEAILGLLGDQEPLAVLESTPEALRRLVGDLGPDDLARPEAEGKWSAAQVLQHLADAELVWGYRLRKVLAEDRPTLVGFDQDLWASRLGYATADAGRALDVFAALRATHLALLRGATDDDLARFGVHEERGEETVAHMMKLYAGHDLAHRRQLERIRAVARGG